DGTELWSRETYWSFYNAGTAAFWFWGRERDFVRPPIPFIAKYMKQLCATIRYFRNNGIKQVYHQDLHMNNVLLHWAPTRILPDAYVCDFGHAS
ncbi:hypothetical protein B0T14DRAFT_389205, partial [Immersiella caudata]